ncbi:MAG: hypothetical protein AAGL49_13205, partial [Pseudomonadota bacterium]
VPVPTASSPLDPTQATFFDTGSIVGFTVPRVSKHSATGTVEYRQPVANDAEAYFRADVIYNSSRFQQIQNIVETGDATKLNLRAGVTFGDIDVSIWAENVTDNDTAPNSFRYVNLRTGGFFGRGSNLVFLPRGRQIGGTVSINF